MLYPYRNSLLDRFEVMYLETNDLGESYVIFETLNARGQELETSDLLKTMFSVSLAAIFPPSKTSGKSHKHPCRT